MIADDKSTFKDWFVDGKYPSKNITISGESKAYIDDLIKKPK